MADRSRREFLRQIGAAVAVGSLGMSGLALPSRSAPARRVRFAVGTLDETDVGHSAGPLELGERYGIAVEITYFQNNDILFQTVASGQQDLCRAGPAGLAAFVDRGVALKMVAVVVGTADYVLIGHDPYRSWDDIRNGRPVFGNEGPTGTSTMMARVLFRKHGIDWSRIQSLRVGGSSTRQTLMAKGGTMDLTLLHYAQWEQVRREAGDRVHAIAYFWEEVPEWIGSVVTVSPRYLESHAEEVAALLASILDMQRRMKADFELYRRTVRQYVPGGGPDDATLKFVWEFARTSNMWPDDGGLGNDAAVQQMMNAYHEAGITRRPLAASEVRDWRPLQRALELLRTA